MNDTCLSLQHNHRRFYPDESSLIDLVLGGDHHQREEVLGLDGEEVTIDDDEKKLEFLEDSPPPGELPEEGQNTVSNF